MKKLVTFLFITLITTMMFGCDSSTTVNNPGNVYNLTWLDGRVVDGFSSAGLDGATLTYVSNSRSIELTAGAEGEFQIKKVPASMELEVRAQASGYMARRQTISAASGDDSTIRMYPADTSVSATLYSIDGPVANAEVFCLQSCSSCNDTGIDFRDFYEDYAGFSGISGDDGSVSLACPTTQDEVMIYVAPVDTDGDGITDYESYTNHNYRALAGSINLGNVKLSPAAGQDTVIYSSISAGDLAPGTNTITLVFPVPMDIDTLHMLLQLSSSSTPKYATASLDSTMSILTISIPDGLKAGENYDLLVSLESISGYSITYDAWGFNVDYADATIADADLVLINPILDTADPDDDRLIYDDWLGFNYDLKGYYGNNNSDLSINVEWTNDQNAASYNIYAKSTGSGNWLMLASDVCGDFHDLDTVCEWSINYWNIPAYFQLFEDWGDSFLVNGSSFSLAAVWVDKNGNQGNLPPVENQVVITDTVGPWLTSVSQVNPEDFGDTGYSADTNYPGPGTPTTTDKTIYLLVGFSEHMDTSGDSDPSITITDSHSNTGDSISCGVDNGNGTAGGNNSSFTWLPGGHYGYFTITVPWFTDQTNDFYVIDYSNVADSSGNPAIEELQFDDDGVDTTNYLTDDISWFNGNTYDPSRVLDDRRRGGCLQ